MSERETAWLVADIGGTHARFALAKPTAGRPALHAVRILNTRDFDSPSQAAEHYLQELNARPDRAALAIAAPAVGEEVRMTNCAWTFRRAELAAALGLEEIRIINDFAACALGVSALEPGEHEPLYGTSEQELVGPVSVIGPGTGMGMAMLLRDSLRRWQVVETEGGHASFAPQNHEERRICDWLAARHGRVSIERVLSGPGLSEIYAALSDLPPDPTLTPSATLPTPAWIVASAIRSEDAMAYTSLARFCAILGSVAGDAALFHGARTLAIAGGMVPRFVPFLRSSAFRERFLAKGRFSSYVAGITVLVVTHPAPGLLGAAVSLDLAPPTDSATP